MRLALNIVVYVILAILSLAFVRQQAVGVVGWPGIGVYIVAVFGGAVVTYPIVRILRIVYILKDDKTPPPEGKQSEADKDADDKAAESFLALSFWTGCLERGIVTTPMIKAPDLVPAFIGAWIALKLAANWASVKERTRKVRRNHMIAILGSTISFFCAIASVRGFLPDAFAEALIAIGK